MNNFQRTNSISNAHVGKDFEDIAMAYFNELGYHIQKNYPINIGFYATKKHRFDLGGTDNNGHRIVIECKSHKWTTGDKVPSAKMTVWNEVMLYFSLLPDNIVKILFVLKNKSIRRQETLSEYYIRTYQHLIPKGVIIMEIEEEKNIVETVYNN